ncbi:hypothetical protein BDP81DRAFT_504958 [Colletotrichum phormii]|uniref:Uncharacterized protein n=1 Tax=Colletotrichum phormii TaxID=359342 RepID=A0AAJ0A135_9PEZI|nr:uncharacterized protein BDP81DRAFT_504958 [Colletotrichum phormii]KAK1641475.1 hypothetical protein BDP81DRAFT_504958 [Colletotrichum phormii]
MPSMQGEETQGKFSGLTFRSENISAEQKVTARRSRVLHAENHPASLDLSWDTRARYAFFSTYIQGFTRSIGEIAYHYRTAKTLDLLSASFEAASLAFMAVQLGSPNLLRLANSSYVTAIQRLNHILCSLEPDEAEKALQTILLLDMYEKLVHRDPGKSQSWPSHAQGGLSLLGARATSIVSTSTGCQVAARLVTAVTVSCATVGDRVPLELTKARRNIGYRVKSVKWTFLGVLAQVVNLKFDIVYGRISALELLVKAKDKRILGCFYDIYPDHYITQVSNAICTIRLILYHLVKTYVPKRVDQKRTPFMEQGAIRSIRSSLQHLSGATLSINQVSEDEKAKAWVQECLKFMWESGGLKAAKEILHVTQTAPDLDYWTVFAMTGSYALGA